jgi:hypothetical protein
VSHKASGLTFFVALIALSIHVAPVSAEDPVATIVSVNGIADIEKLGSTIVSVTTGPDATVVVTYDSIHDVTIYQNTQLQLDAGLGLRVGTVRVRGTFTVRTANAQSSVNDSEMTVAYDNQSGYTTIEVADREASVRGSSDEADLLVPAGQMVRIGADGIASRPQAISVDEITAARVDSIHQQTSAGQRRFNIAVAGIAVACLLAGLIGSRRSRKIAYLA